MNSLPIATLQRLSDDGNRTRGRFTLGNLNFHTIEEPWKDNKTGISCIPPGRYRVVPHGWEPNTKLKQKRSYRLLGTEPRVAILIHVANTTDDIEGCIGPGLTTGKLNGKDAVLQSGAAMDQLRKLMGPSDFIIDIKAPA